MITPLDDLLSVDTLTGLVTAFADQSQNRTCSNLFARRARPLVPLGESASWDEVTFARHLAPVSGPESPHTRAKRLKTRKRSSVMAWIKLYKDLPASHLFLNRAPGSSFADAERILAIELEELGNLIANTREFLATGALLGRIDVNEQTVPGSDLAFTVEFGNAESAASASWADPQTLIRSEQLIELRQHYKDVSGLRAEIGITEPGVEGYLVKNQEIKEYAKEPLGQQILQNVVLNGEAPQWSSLGNLSWRFTDGTYKPEGGPVTRYFPPGRVLVLPHESRLPQVLGWAEGLVHVPDGPVYGDVREAVNALRPMRGTYAYAEIRTDPVGIRIFAGWHGLPVVLNPNAVLVYNATPGAVPAPAPTPAP